jgi:glucosamine 6-phosphate synthetase-like amidotransferase/phosphosugar isomerase protein
MGHTRLPTRGSVLDNRNNHPIRAGMIIGTHNGTIYNADWLFKKLRLPRYTEVDSELIFRLADRCAVDGGIELSRFKKSLARCRGQISAVLASRLDPGVVTVLKGNKPLSLAYCAKKRVILYASQAEFITCALNVTCDWSELEIPPMTAVTIRCLDLKKTWTESFSFKRQKKKIIKVTGESI